MNIKPMNDDLSNKNTERLIKYLRKGQVDLFLGSGFSFDAGAPKAWDIIKAMLEDGGADFKKDFPEENQSLKIVSEEFEKRFGRNDLIKLLNQLFTFTPKDTTAQKLLYMIPHLRTIFTTNYDTLLEDTNPREERVLITSNIGCAYTDDKKVAIYKIHGDITTMNDPDGIVITESDYKNYFKSNRYDLIWKRLQQSFVQKYILFIGYSLEDDNVIDIIRRVRKSINNNMKGMFLVAPNLNSSKISQLQKNGIKYINSTAVAILKRILDDLKDTVYIDFKHKDLTREIFDAFCRINGDLLATTTNHEDSNSIDMVSALPNKTKDTKLKFTIDNEIKKRIEEGVYKDKLFIKGTHIPITATKLPTKDVITLELRANGIKFADKEDFSSLTFAPTYQRSVIKIKIKSLGFSENVECYRYKDRNEAHLDIETPIFVLKFTAPISKDSHRQVNINITFKDKYNSNSEALKWIDVAIAMADGTEMLLDAAVVTPNKMRQDVIDVLKRMKKYYLIISRIENDTDISFSRYDGYNDNNYIHALYVYSYNVKGGMSSEIPKNATLSFEVDTRDEANVPIDKFRSNEFVMCEERHPGEFKLNGMTFNIPYAVCVYMDCKSKSIKKKDKYCYDILMQNVAPKYYIYCSDKPPRQDGNIFRITG